jgi:hypothetical protein
MKLGGQIVWRPLSPKWLEQNGLKGMDQAVEHMFCKCEAMSSNPSPTKKKEKYSSMMLKT